MLKKQIITVATLLMMTGLVSQAWSQTVHKWVDEDGVVHFSQTAPDQNQASEETSLKTAPMTGGTFATPRPEVNEDSTEITSGQESSQSSSQSDPAKCTRARETLATLDTGRRIRLQDPDTGELAFATEEDRAEQRRRATEQVSRYCN